VTAPSLVAPSAVRDATVPADPGAAWLGHMRRGDFAAAWEVSDAVLRARRGAPSWHLPRHEQWVWNGEPLGGRRVLVRCYHGLGDTLQFVRFAAPLREIAAEVTLWAQPALLPLLATVRGVDRLLPLHDGAPDGAYDAELEVMELPHALRVTLDDLPRDVPYVHVEPAPRFGDGLHVGVVWAAGDWDPRRGLTVDALAPLARIPGVTLHALQRGAALAAWDASLGPVSGSDDVAECARIMTALDLVVSVDSMPAHLAGALGVPVWTLLHADADWRWMTGRDDSPWYPTMQLVRQARAGDWRAPIARVAHALARLAATHHSNADGVS
jgi:Glycosyltransferase family 9 (heptosyltransferase)